MRRLIDADALIRTIRQHDYLVATMNNSIDAGMFTIGIQQAVDDQPTIDTYGTWIPCSERLPILDDSDGGVKQSDICLCAIKWNDGEITEETGWYNSSGLWNYDSTDCKVIAWMPLPGPYREEKKDE